MSASISCSEALEAVRRGEKLSTEVVRQLGEEQPSDFFRIIIEALADSFDPAQVTQYEELMRAWIPAATQPVQPAIPERVDAVYVLSRVTLGADIKITSAILDAMKTRFPQARIVLVSNRKSAELFSGDTRIEHHNADYPRTGPVSARIEFAHRLREELMADHRIVVDPDSRMTQLGLIPVCERRHYFHFPSRTANGSANLTRLTDRWLQEHFAVTGRAYVAVPAVPTGGERPRAAVSLGVGENDSKRIGGDFEAQMIRTLGAKFHTVWVDRGVGGEEARRVTEAVETSGCADKVRYWEGSFAGFASVISQCDFYTGYDSAGQHAAAASSIPLITLFKGACSDRFRQRWSASGNGRIDIINADLMTPEQCLARFSALLE